MNNEIKVVSMRRQSPCGNLRAFVEVRVGDITIADCRIIQQPGQKAHLSGPQKQIEGGRWVPLVKMTAALRDRVQGIVLAEAEKAGIVDKVVPEQPDLMMENL